MNIYLTPNKKLYNFCKPYIIAEIGSNHNGDLELAKKLISEAKEAGANCVKCQSWTSETIFSRKKYKDNFFLNDDYRNRDDYTMEEIVSKYSLSESELLELKKYSDDLKIDFSSTPFSNKEVNFLVEKLESPFIKVASMDLNNTPFLEYIASFGKPIVLSTGLSELYEIDKAVKVIERSNNFQIIILHCVATYPPEDNEFNLNNIKSLQKIYPEYPIGFSDHSIGTVIPLAATSLGACLIEKHFTLDKNMEGWDHKISANKCELKKIVLDSKRINDALGSNRIISTEDKSRKLEFRRSIVLTKKLKKGDIIKEGDLDFKRPGGGFEPGFKDFLIGRLVKRDLDYDHIITQDDLV